MGNEIGSRRQLQFEKLEARQLLAAVCSSGRDVFTVGLVECTADAYEGYTLLTPDRNGDAFLLDVHGREVHSWTGAPYNGRRGAYLGPDGSLYSSGTISNPAQSSGGVTGALYIQDWDGNVTWNFNYSNASRTLHHDIEVMPNGNVLAFAWVEYSAAELISQGRNPATIPGAGEMWGERVVELEPTGPTTANVVWEWNIIDHLIQDFDSSRPNFGVVADHPERFDVNLGQGVDWIHLNAIDYNPQLDQILINSPFHGEFYVLDHSTTTAEAATGTGGNSGRGGDFLYRWGNPSNYDTPGPLQMFNQHDAQWIDPGNPGAGNFLVFNNQAVPSSTVIEIIPPAINAMGNYAYTPGTAYGPAAPITTLDTGVNAGFISGAHRLPNGNTLFVHGPNGIIGELTPANEQVWEYHSPLTPTGTVPQGANPPNDNVFKSRRYSPDFSGFAGRNLSPQGYVENWTPGDYDLSGAIDSTDLQALCGGLSTNDRIYDLTFEDLVDVADIEEMVTSQLGTLMGDANLDGLVDGEDFLRWNANKFQPSMSWAEGNFNCDGVVDGLDFIIWNQNKFMSASPRNASEGVLVQQPLLQNLTPQLSQESTVVAPDHRPRVVGNTRHESLATSVLLGPGSAAEEFAAKPSNAIRSTRKPRTEAIDDSVRQTTMDPAIQRPVDLFEE